MAAWASSTNIPSCGAPYSHPFTMSLNSQQLSPSWVHSPNPMFQHPSPPLHQQTHDSGWGMQGCSMYHLCRSYSVLPATDQMLHSHSSPQSFLSVPVDLPATEGASLRGGTSPLLQLPTPGVQVPSLFFCLCFFFFLLPYPSVWGVSSLLRGLRSSASVQ